MIDKRQRFEQLVLPHLDAAYNFARWLCDSTTDAEDIAQEALLLAFRGFDEWRGDGIKAWLFTIVRNCHHSAARRTVPKSRVTDAIDEAATVTPGALVSADSPELAAIAAEQTRALDAILRDLPADFRAVLVLREMEGLSYREIAAVVGVPIGTVMSRLARAREALKCRWLQIRGGTDRELS